ncbi:hypothetical protein MCBMB27_02632 [Methylobacterium phyllosphaerae]|uniref:Uncharacterized protein n=1 Tax=Methylobacterium phyllosphaerae TaxID=418223 RepID=A0AAE8L6X1_9HYPH|nr:hypothetical protein [Methylobacterium phyllosphaerae]APT31923.1 hypothetical protein MCBMB27_02632 [Methylobacterium phyllosphaerae]SFH01495.1 hypothetical protein SAMN05192567_11235 [Methylobacterium phyllosphaerae]
MRKRIGIEAFFKWAYRDELPKAQCEEGDVGPAGFGSGMGGVIAMAEVGALVDYARENAWGVIPDRYAKDDPHPDAIRAAVAMASLDDLELCLPDDWNPITDLGDVGLIHRVDLDAGRLGRAAVDEALADLTTVDAKGNRLLKGGVRRLVMRFAVLNGEPGWEIERPWVKFVCVGKGRPGWFRREIVQGADGPYEIEVDGFDRKRRMPHPDAYRKPYLHPNPVEGIYDRGLHEVYVAALHLLHAELVDKLTGYALELPSRPARPWVDDAPCEPRILLGAKPTPLLERVDDTPMPETDFAAPAGLPRAHARPIRKNSPVRRVAVA